MDHFGNFHTWDPGTFLGNKDLFTRSETTISEFPFPTVFTMQNFCYYLTTNKSVQQTNKKKEACKYVNIRESSYKWNSKFVVGSGEQIIDLISESIRSYRFFLSFWEILHKTNYSVISNYVRLCWFNISINQSID